MNFGSGSPYISLEEKKRKDFTELFLAKSSNL